jgi:hypothetical protein
LNFINNIAQKDCGAIFARRQRAKHPRFVNKLWKTLTSQGDIRNKECVLLHQPKNIFI